MKREVAMGNLKQTDQYKTAHKRDTAVNRMAHRFSSALCMYSVRRLFALMNDSTESMKANDNPYTLQNQRW